MLRTFIDMNTRKFRCLNLIGPRHLIDRILRWLREYRGLVLLEEYVLFDGEGREWLFG